jgi:seryl-tRNA synthetase
MHDIKKIRDDPKEFDQQLKKRNINPLSSSILKIDAKRRKNIASLEILKSSINSLSKDFGRNKSLGKSIDEKKFKDVIKEKKLKISKLEDESQKLETNLKALLENIPNICSLDVPDGVGEEDNVEVYKWGKIKKMTFEPKQHFDVLAASDIDFKSAAKISGSRFSVLSGGIATLHRAISQFMIDKHIKDHELKEVSVPVLVKDNIMYGTGQLPKFSTESYKTSNGWWLIPTAEVPLTNLMANTILNYDELPIRLCAVTQCFRSEAGSAGKDTTGMLRQHQFEKVEMVTFSSPENSKKEHLRMTDCAENILKELEIPFRKVELCTGDLGFSSKKTYDLEVWLPGQKKYREISSISNCGDFQSRRMNARYRQTSESKPSFLHTLNGSGLAVGRCLIAIIENNQTFDGKIEIPKCLSKYLFGAKFLTQKGYLE